MGSNEAADNPALGRRRRRPRLTPGG